MLKSVIISSVVVLGAATSVSAPADLTPVTAEQTALNIPQVDTVVAQFSYLEIRHDVTGFGVSIADKTAMFVDVEFPGNLRVRVGF